MKKIAWILLGLMIVLSASANTTLIPLTENGQPGEDSKTFYFTPWEQLKFGFVALGEDAWVEWAKPRITINPSFAASVDNSIVYSCNSAEWFTGRCSDMKRAWNTGDDADAVGQKYAYATILNPKWETEFTVDVQFDENTLETYKFKPEWSEEVKVVEEIKVVPATWGQIEYLFVIMALLIVLALELYSRKKES